MDIKRTITTRGIIFHEGKLFAQKLKQGDGTRSYWCMPGGKLDAYESITDGLHREIVEETGIVPRIGRLLFVQQYTEGDHEFMEYFFHIENATDYQTISLNETTHGELEIAECEFVDLSANIILPRFLSEIDVASYIDDSKPVLFENYLTD